MSKEISDEEDNGSSAELGDLDPSTPVTVGILEKVLEKHFKKHFEEHVEEHLKPYQEAAGGTCRGTFETYQEAAGGT